MATFNFLMENPNTTPPNAPTLYLGESNQLNFIFSNTLGVTSLSNGDIITIAIPDTLITSADAGQLLSEDWEISEQGITHAQHIYTYNLTPKTEVQWKTDLVISLNKLQSDNATNGKVDCNCIVSGQSMGEANHQLFTSEVPSDKDQELMDFITIANPPQINAEQTAITRGSIYTSPVVKVGEQEQLSPPIANQLHINIKYSKLGELVDKPWKGTPSFSFSFSYGNNGNDLTNAIKAGEPHFNPLTSAWNISARISEDQGSQWHLNTVIQNAPSPKWIVVPRDSNPHLFTTNAPDLDIYFDHIISAVAPDNASVYIQWTNIPGYNDGYYVMNLPKLASKPEIISFSNKFLSFPSSELVELDWESFGANELVLSWVDNAVSGIGGNAVMQVFSDQTTPALTYSGNNKLAVGALIPPFQDRDASYTCKLVVPNDNSTQKELTISLARSSPPVITDFSATIVEQEDDLLLTLNWSVETDNVNAYCIIDVMNGPQPLKGSYSVSVASLEELPDAINLTVRGFWPQVTSELKLDLKVTQTVDNFLVMDRSPNSNTLFLTKGDSIYDTKDNRLFYCDALNIPDQITENITIGNIATGNTRLFLSPNGEKAFAVNSNYPTSNNVVYYFDPVSPPSAATDSIEVGNYPYSVFFLPDSSRAFVTDVEDNSIAYFDPANPPLSVTPQINVPGGSVMDQGRQMAFSPDGIKAFWWRDDHGPIYKSYHFDPANPPATLGESNLLSSEYNFLYFDFSPDNSTVFVNQQNGHRESYFPLDNIPPQPESAIKFASNPLIMAFSPKSKWAFQSCESENPLVYFDWSNPPDKPIHHVNLPLHTYPYYVLAINPTGDTLYFTDYSNLFYISITDPMQDPKVIPVGVNAREVYFSLKGTRVFVNCYQGPATTITILNVCYTRQ